MLGEDIGKSVNVTLLKRDSFNSHKQKKADVMTTTELKI